MASKDLVRIGWRAGWLAVWLVGCGVEPNIPTTDETRVDPDEHVETDPITNVPDKAPGDTLVQSHGQTAGIPKSCTGSLKGVVRDFNSSHPDFQNYPHEHAAHGLVADMLGADQKPVFASDTGDGVGPSLSGPDAFAQWFNDVPGVNAAVPIELKLTRNAKTHSWFYDDQTFFPVDGKGLTPAETFAGFDGQQHNFHFTLEIHARFVYRGGETFQFVGDDDIWVYLDNKLVIDLGGVHGVETGLVKLDDLAAQNGWVKGQSYALDLFYAERYTPGSTFRVDTSIECVNTGAAF